MLFQFRIRQNQSGDSVAAQLAPHQIINILRHSRRFFKCACKALLPAAP
ncbi:flagellar biosynthesis protein FlgF [Escherichia coli]|nr:flagellar biosynthesis protein FlgF [Escherichia coli]